MDTTAATGWVEHSVPTTMNAAPMIQSTQVRAGPDPQRAAEVHEEQQRDGAEDGEQRGLAVGRAVAGEGEDGRHQHGGPHRALGGAQAGIVTDQPRPEAPVAGAVRSHPCRATASPPANLPTPVHDVCAMGSPSSARQVDRGRCGIRLTATHGIPWNRRSTNFLYHYSYLAIFVLSFISSMGIPAGAEVAIIGGGALASGEVHTLVTTAIRPASSSTCRWCW